MMRSDFLQEFIHACQEHYTCFSLATTGLEMIAEKFRPHILNEDKQRLFVGNSDPNEGKPAQAVVLLNDVIQYSSKNGKFHDQLAKL